MKSVLMSTLFVALVGCGAPDPYAWEPFLEGDGDCDVSQIEADFPLIEAGRKSTFLFSLIGARPEDRIDFIRPPLLHPKIRLSLEVNSTDLVAVTMENTSTATDLNPPLVAIDVHNCR